MDSQKTLASPKRAGEPACPPSFLMTKPCTTCKIEKPLSEYSPQLKGLYGKTASCKTCRNIDTRQWQKDNPDKVRNDNYIRKFGITLAEYNVLLAAQNGVCAICKLKCTIGRALAVDHNHTTKKNRGLLCQQCNVGIGSLKESPERLQRAMDYLNAYL